MPAFIASEVGVGCRRGRVQAQFEETELSTVSIGLLRVRYET